MQSQQNNQIGQANVIMVAFVINNQELHVQS